MADMRIDRSLVLVAALLLSACHTTAPSAVELELAEVADLQPLASPGQRLEILATTSIVADVVKAVGGADVDVTSLVPLGVDPHAFEPAPRDVQRLADADLVFINGFGLESFLGDLLRDAGGGTPLISVSQGITPLAAAGDGEQGEGPARPDPHIWLDPNNVARWTETIEAALAAVDPAHSGAYAARAEAYRAELADLDREIRESVSRIPPENRRLVTDHDELAYFADEYGFTVAGTVIPGASSLAEPSPGRLAALLQTVRSEAIPAIFVSSVVNPSLIETFARDAGVHIVSLQAHSLTTSDGPAPTYLDLMRYNAEAIAAALTP
jgi:ABC-type Zn uptake system ZnuABC Zn-binding protein ZnuA